MRKQTLLGFLSEYTRYLSYSGSLNIHSLYSEMNEKNHRLKEPLFLYSYYNRKSEVLKKYLTDKDKAEFSHLEELLTENRLSELPADYAKVFNSYQCKLGKTGNENRVKSLMIDRIIKLKQEKNISNYKIYTSLGINPGNFNDFIKNRKTNKLGLQKSREVLQFLESYNNE